MIGVVGKCSSQFRELLSRYSLRFGLRNHSGRERCVELYVGCLDGCEGVRQVQKVVDNLFAGKKGVGTRVETLVNQRLGDEEAPYL